MIVLDPDAAPIWGSMRGHAPVAYQRIFCQSIKKIGISGIKGVMIYPKFKFSPIALTFLEHMGVGVSFNPVPDRLHTPRVEIGSRFRIRVPVLVFVDTPY